MQEGTISQEVILNYLKKRVGLLDGVVISGGEPTLQNNLKEFIKRIKSLGFLVKLDTNGTNPETLRELVSENLIDYIAMDIKAPFESYNKITIIQDIEKIKQSVEFIKNCGVNYEFRTTFAPNLTKEDIVNILKSISGAKTYSLQAYFKPNYVTNENLKNHLPQTFYEIKEIANEYVENFNIKNL